MSSTNKLSVSRVVDVTMTTSAAAASTRSFGILCVAGDTDVIDGSERLRTYTSIDGVGGDFSSTDPEYKAALLYFSQSPCPKKIMIGRWISSATVAILEGESATTDVDTWAAISDGAMDIVINETTVSLTGLDFSSCTSMSGVAAVINTALADYDATCTWDGSNFYVKTTATGSSATLNYATAPDDGTDISTLAGLTEDLAYDPIDGYDAETPAECAETLADASSAWYGLMFAASTSITIAQHTAVAAYIEAASISRVYGVTLTDSRCLKSTYTEDLGSVLSDAGYSRTVLQYSSSSDYAIASFLGRAFAVKFKGSLTCITMKFKDEPEVDAEYLTESQADTLTSKHINVFVEYDNDTAIVQEGVTADGTFFDEVHGLDWLQNYIQTKVWNLLYQSTTKIPQTEKGMTQIKNRIAAALTQAVNNGLVAPGVWNGDEFGNLSQGDYLDKGYYIYSESIDDQDSSDREDRIAPDIQVAAKLAGAVHFVDVTVNVNR